MNEVRALSLNVTLNAAVKCDKIREIRTAE